MLRTETQRTQARMGFEVITTLNLCIYYLQLTVPNVEPRVRSRCRATRKTVWGSNVGRGKTFLSHPKRPTRRWSPPILLFNAYRSSFLGVKRPGREVDRSPASSFEVKNEWSITSLPPPLLCLNGVDRATFISSLLNDAVSTSRYVP